MSNPNPDRDEHVDVEQVAKEFIQRYYSEGAWKDKADAWLFNNLVTTLNTAATRMRDRCVEKVKRKANGYQKDSERSDYLPNYRRNMALAASTLREVANDLQSLTLEREQEK